MSEPSDPDDATFADHLKARSLEFKALAERKHVEGKENASATASSIALDYDRSALIIAALAADNDSMRAERKQRNNADAPQT